MHASSSTVRWMEATESSPPPSWAAWGPIFCRCRKNDVATSSRIAASAALAFDQGFGDPLLNDFAFLVDDLPLPADDAAPAAGADFLLQDFAAQANGIADENRLLEIPVAHAQEGERAHGGRPYP